MTDFEKLGVFYIGREYDRASGALTETPILVFRRPPVKPEQQGEPT